MAQVKTIKVLVRLSELHTQSTRVPAWEFPVLQAVHGDNVKAVGETVVERPIPDAQSEHKRLQDRFRTKDGQLPAVAAVYGSFGLGVSNLNRAINDSIVGGVDTEKAEEPVSAADIEAGIRAQVALERAQRDAAAKLAAADAQDAQKEPGDSADDVAKTAVALDATLKAAGNAGFDELVGAQAE